MAHVDTAISAPGSAAASGFSVKTQVRLASLTITGLVLGLGGWAAMTSISGAVIAPGTFVVERNVKKVQHSYGGIVSEINVKIGDRVNAGAIVISLDATPDSRRAWRNQVAAD